MAHDFATQEKAEELYVLNGLTYDAIAEELEVSSRTIANWSAEGKWKQKRAEFRRASADIRRYATLTRLNLIKKAMRSTDPQTIYAFAALERATANGPLPDAPAGESLPVEPREIRTPEDAVKALEDAVSAKLNAMLANPEALNLRGIQDIKKSMDLIRTLKEQAASVSVSKPDAGIDSATIADIRNQLGL